MLPSDFCRKLSALLLLLSLGLTACSGAQQVQRGCLLGCPETCAGQRNATVQLDCNSTSSQWHSCCVTFLNASLGRWCKPGCNQTCYDQWSATAQLNCDWYRYQIMGIWVRAQQCCANLTIQAKSTEHTATSFLTSTTSRVPSTLKTKEVIVPRSSPPPWSSFTTRETTTDNTTTGSAEGRNTQDSKSSSPRTAIIVGVVLGGLGLLLLVVAVVVAFVFLRKRRLRPFRRRNAESTGQSPHRERSVENTYETTPNGVISLHQDVTDNGTPPVANGHGSSHATGSNGEGPTVRVVPPVVVYENVPSRSSGDQDYETTLVDNALYGSETPKNDSSGQKVTASSSVNPLTSTSPAASGGMNAESEAVGEARRVPYYENYPVTATEHDQDPTYQESDTTLVDNTLYGNET